MWLTWSTGRSSCYSRSIVPTLCVGMPQGTLRVPALERDAERPGLHSHAERGNDHNNPSVCYQATTR
ncbi:hypothetical protein CES87_20800 [Pseudomonas sp. ERMR1:02]|nr:hypothetical protein CES87_20800 [Pseudomonas sp. ERMR1:02]